MDPELASVKGKKRPAPPPPNPFGEVESPKSNGPQTRKNPFDTNEDGSEDTEEVSFDSFL